MARPEALFMGKVLFESALDNQRDQLLKEIDQMGSEQVLNTDPEKLIAALADKYWVNVPVIPEENAISIETRDATVGGSDPWGDQQRLRGTEFDFHVRYEGDTVIFRLRPPSIGRIPRATVGEQSLVLTYLEAPGLGLDAKRDFELDLAAIKSYLEDMRKKAEPFNESLVGAARDAVEARRNKLLGDEARAIQLGYPLRRRLDTAGSYVVPAVQKRPRISMPEPGKNVYVREPALDMAEYEDILGIIGHVGVAMERSPSIFRNLAEEDLRFHFVIALNGTYMGAAMGEAFNLAGKTDILVRYDDRNVFIAECKFWTGPKGLAAAIDQLLGYISWRDTKTAVVLFSRDVSMSTVLEKVPATVRKHSNYLATVPYDRDGAYRFRLHQPGDRGRELVLTVVVFAVPA
jgi:hypothetical protein